MLDFLFVYDILVHFIYLIQHILFYDCLFVWGFSKELSIPSIPITISFWYVNSLNFEMNSIKLKKFNLALD